MIAAAFDGSDTPVLDARLIWSSSNDDVATVNDAGLVTALGNGVAVVTVASGDASATADITVSQEAVRVVISPREIELVERNATEQLSVTAFDVNDF